MQNNRTETLIALSIHNKIQKITEETNAEADFIGQKYEAEAEQIRRQAQIKIRDLRSFGWQMKHEFRNKTDLSVQEIQETIEIFCEAQNLTSDLELDLELDRSFKNLKL